jgi:hypothetical protein
MIGFFALPIYFLGAKTRHFLININYLYQTITERSIGFAAATV